MLQALFMAHGRDCNSCEIRGTGISYKLPAPGTWEVFNRILISDFLLILLCLIPVDLITDYLLPDRKYLCNETAVLNVTLCPEK